MILLQLSSGQGPVECCRAVGLALTHIEQQAKENRLNVTTVELVNTAQPGCYRSALLHIEPQKKGSVSMNALDFAQSWQGPMQWVCQSAYRPKNKRKNWFFSGVAYEVLETRLDKQISYQTCRSSGAGGQHVNKTDSAVRATHIATGLSVKIESERSQHANKRLAKALLFHKLEYQQQADLCQQEKARWQQHWQVERGNPIKTFNGKNFKLIGNKK